jgi:hypothetical protein
MERSRLGENGGCVALFAGLSWDVQGAAEKPLLHLLSENYNLTRRVLAIAGHSDRKSSDLACSNRKRCSMLCAPLSIQSVVLSPRPVTVRPVARGRCPRLM